MKYPISATLSLPPVGAGESAASVGALRFLKAQGFDGADLSTYFLDLSDWRRTYEEVAAAREEAGLPFLGSHLPFYGAEMMLETAEFAIKVLRNYLDKRYGA